MIIKKRFQISALSKEKTICTASLQNMVRTWFSEPLHDSVFHPLIQCAIKSQKLSQFLINASFSGRFLSGFPVMGSIHCTLMMHCLHSERFKAGFSELSSNIRIKEGPVQILLQDLTNLVYSVEKE